MGPPTPLYPKSDQGPGPTPDPNPTGLHSEKLGPVQLHSRDRPG